MKDRRPASDEVSWSDGEKDMTTKNNKRETKGNGKALDHGIKKETSPAPKSSKANELTLRAWKKTYENRNKASKAA